jgi:hypothetical protein
MLEMIFLEIWQSQISKKIISSIQKNFFHRRKRRFGYSLGFLTLYSHY